MYQFIGSFSIWQWLRKTLRYWLMRESYPKVYLWLACFNLWLSNWSWHACCLLMMMSCCNTQVWRDISDNIQLNVFKIGIALAPYNIVSGCTWRGHPSWLIFKFCFLSLVSQKRKYCCELLTFCLDIYIFFFYMFVT